MGKTGATRQTGSVGVVYKEPESMMKVTISKASGGMLTLREDSSGNTGNGTLRVVHKGERTKDMTERINVSKQRVYRVIKLRKGGWCGELTAT